MTQTTRASAADRRDARAAAAAPDASGVFTHRQIITAVWGAGTNADAQFVRVLMAQLRQKLEANPSSPELLLTEPGIGYRLSCDDEG